MKLILLKSEKNNPYRNLAIEQIAFDWIHENKDCIMLYTWINDKSVIIGRNQNPYVECNLEDMERDGVLLVRRKTGGGAVYHDLGNLNYTIIANGQYVDKNIWNIIICGSLGRVGIDCVFSGRNDFLVEGRKVSGSAFMRNGDTFLQHGTLLINVSRNALKKYLTPEKSKMQKHGIQSVEQRICNLVEINSLLTINEVEKALQSEMIDSYPTFEIKHYVDSNIFDENEIEKISKQYSDDTFLYGDFSYGDKSDDGL